MDSSEFYTFEDQAYVNPKLSSGEQEAFINNLRDIQNQNNQQIAADTYNLGKALPSNLGGLGGGESYFNARYQNDQVDDMVANLKTASQAQQLNDAMTNYNNQLKQRYNKAQQSYNRRRARSGYGSSGYGNNLLDTLNKLLGTNKEKGASGNVNETNVTGGSGNLVQRVKGSNGTTVASGRYYYNYNDAGLITSTDDPSYSSYGNIYIPNSVRDNMNAAKTKFGPLAGTLGQAAANKILQDYINNR